MKAAIVASAFVLGGVAGQAMGACTDGQVTDTATATIPTTLMSLLDGKTVCAVRGTDKWQEMHISGGELDDYKLGTDPMDPTQKVGDWSVDGSGSSTMVHYHYLDGSTYSFTVHTSDNTHYSFCAGAGDPLVDIHNATVISTPPCP